MESLVFKPTYELFLVLEPFAGSYQELSRSLAPLCGDEAPALLGVDLYHRRRTDIALLALRFDERELTFERLAWVLDLAAGAALPALDPLRLRDDDRRRFYDAYLSRYDTRLEDYPDIRAALQELGRRLALSGDLVEVQPLDHDGEAQVSRARGSQPPRVPPRLPTAPLDDPATVSDAESRTLLGQGEPRGAVARELHQRLITIEDPDPPRPLQASDSGAVTNADPLPLPARGKNKHRVRRPTLPATPVAIRTSPGAERPASADGAAPSRAASDSGVEIVASNASLSSIDVQFRRGSTWFPARLRSLGSRGAYLVTGAPPRLGDQVDIALGYQMTGTIVRGTVHHITTAEDAVTTGSSGFAVRFPAHDGPARRQLIVLLKKARAAGVTIKPPPSRGAVRFPVRWPVRVACRNRSFAADAMDVSVGGLFVATHCTLTEADELVFRLPLDTEEPAVRGCARIARVVDDRMARSRNLERGYGLRIVELADGDRDRYEHFLARVRQRTDKRVVVGAAGDRAAALAEGLMAAGYTVATGDDAAALVRMADFELRAPDLAVLDASLGEEALPGQWLEQIFSGRKVPCLAIDQESVEVTRLRADALLDICP